MIVSKKRMIDMNDDIKKRVEEILISGYGTDCSCVSIAGGMCRICSVVQSITRLIQLEREKSAERVIETIKKSRTNDGDDGGPSACSCHIVASAELSLIRGEKMK